MKTSKVDGIRCLDCNDVIWSRHLHDMVWCKCRKVSVDGGRSYMKVSFTDRPPENVEVLIDEDENKVGYIKCRVEKRSS